jgi:hypothetical protein
MLGMLMLGMLGMVGIPLGIADLMLKNTTAPMPTITASTTAAMTNGSAPKPVDIETRRGTCGYENGGAAYGSTGGGP